MTRLVCFCIYLSCLATFQVTAEEMEIPVAEKKVARAQFTTAIVDREPVDRIAIVAPPLDVVYFFTDLRAMEGHTIAHRWEYKGQLMSQTLFDVGGPRWRVYSKKVLEPGTYGEWSVTVLDETGWPWYVELFRYDPPESKSPDLDGSARVLE